LSAPQGDTRESGVIRLPQRLVEEDRALNSASRLVGELMDLPTFPQIAHRLLEMTEDESKSLIDVARVIEMDQALTAKVLRVANSAMYGSKRQIRSIQHATVMLGMDNVRKYALTISVFGTRGTGSAVSDYENKRRTWVHAMAVAVLARLIAKELGCGDVETAVVAGLIHDIGKVVFEILRPGEYEQVAEMAREEQLDLITAERRVLGTDHCALGAELGHRWNLPPDLVAVLAQHHDHTCVRTASPGKLSPVHLVHLSNFLCHQIGIADHPNMPGEIVDVTGWAKIGVSVPDLVSLLGSVQNEIEQSIDYFDLGPVNLAEYCDSMDEENQRLVVEGLASEGVQRHLRQRIADLMLVTEGVLTVESDATVGEVLAHVADGALSQLDFDRTIIYTLNGDRATLTPRAVYGGAPALSELPALSTLETEEPVIRAVLEGGARRLRAKHDYEPGQSALLDLLQPGSSGVVPLRVQGTLAGFVLVDNRVAGAPITENDIRVLDTIGKQINMVLDRAATYESLSEKTEELRDLAFRDPLTGVYNYRYLEECLDMEIRRAERYGGAFTVFMLDIDHFKRFNDTYGHQSGDEVLRLFVEVVRSRLRESDVLFRYGGEEFMVLLPDTRKGRALVPAENVRRAVEAASLAEVVPDAPDLRVTCSVGVASYPEDARTRASLIGFADDALYRAKNGGRNRVVVAVRRE
jgi:two-component system, cell cycle response regulator